MKILIATGIFPPEIGGPATIAMGFGTHLIQAGHIVHVVTYSDQVTLDFDQQFPFSVKRIMRRSKLSNYLRFFWYLLFNMSEYDVVYSLDWFSVGVPLWLASIFKGKKYFVRVGGGYIWEKYLASGRPPLTMREFYEKKLYSNYPIMYFFIRKVLQHAVCVIFNSEVQARMYNEHYLIPAERVRVIFNPTELISVSVARTMPTKEIVFAGRFIVMKNIESLVRAFTLIHDKTYTLLLIGEGPMDGILRALVKELGIDNRVVWSHSLPRKDLYERIINCAYVVIPSWTDISPNQVYECLALGIPFLLTSENYLAIADKNFMKIDPKSFDDIVEKMNILSDSKMYEQFSTELKAINFSYGWDELLKDHLQVFNDFT